MGLVKSLCKGDPVVWVVFFVLLSISLIEVFSSTSILTYSKPSHWIPFTNHCIMVITGIVVVVVCHRIPYEKFRMFGTILYPLAALLLAYLTIRGMFINGAARWINLFGVITFQPSELGKLSVIILVSIILARHKANAFEDKKSFVYIMVISLLMCVLILRENFSTALILFLTVYLMMFIGRIPSKQMFKLTMVGAILGAIFLLVVFTVPNDNAGSNFFHRFSVWKERIVDFVTPIDCSADDYVINDDNRQISHANIAIASSNIIGCMPGNSEQRDFLAQAYSDFIYAIIIEEIGLLGGIFVFSLYFILLIRAGRIARQCDKAFPAYMVIGLAVLMVTQAVVNMAVSVGLSPVTGQTLPLISRGGTSMLMNCLYIGIILSVSKSNEERIKHQRLMQGANEDAQDEISGNEQLYAEDEKV